ncbi:filamentous hemagglutinin N-terminal domain-containing protein [Enterovibrio norvegicus]|uniref:two-partner secretion domain-containing protein n=1 Tax=Enterovibrio norvegicus TaxID=188144 RepID=UPI0024B0DB12|nr:filamentous hemagglutinin N-terminal domain-containing protein [Enterovibrio norvegicus]
MIDRVNIARNKITRAVYASSFFIIASNALANVELPSGGVIIAGEGSIEYNGQVLNIQQLTPKMINEWAKFNVGDGSTVNFIQPDKNAISLNRVISDNPSSILGNLSANGQVFLINSNGVVFGGNSSIDTGGFLVSTLDIDNDKFLSGDYEFTGGDSAGSIVNLGQINVGDDSFIAFISPNISNQGELVANKGSVSLVAGDKVNIDFDGDGLITYEIEQGLINSLVSNKGSILAENGMVVMTARARGEIADSIVNNEGVIEALGFSSKGGRVFLHAEGGQSINAGVIDVSSVNGKGGTIRHTGKAVVAESGSRYNASGDFGGGKIEVGGSWQNSDSNVAQAKTTIIESGSVISANALIEGDGGQIVAWSDLSEPEGQTRVNGTLQATGGLAGGNGGNGGNVETSGTKVVLDDIDLDLNAPRGKNGTWLIDPTDIIIRDGITTTPGSSDLPNYESTTDTSLILAADIETQLNSGTNVIIQTGSGGTELGNIRVNGAIEKSSGGDASLTLKSHNNIFVYRAISSTSGQLDITLQSNIDDTDGGIQVKGSSTHIATNGGDFTVTGGSNGTDGAEANSGSGSGFDFGNGASIITNGGNVHIHANGENLVGVNMSNGTIDTGPNGGINIISSGTGTPLLIKESSGGTVKLLAGSGGITIDVETSGVVTSKDAISFGNNLDNIYGQHVIQATNGNILINAYSHADSSAANTNSAFKTRADLKIETVSSGDIEMNLHSEHGAGLKFDDQFTITSAGNININAKSENSDAIESVDLRSDGNNNASFTTTTGDIFINSESKDDDGIFVDSGTLNFDSVSGDVNIRTNQLNISSSNTTFSSLGDFSISTENESLGIVIGNSGTGLVLDPSLFGSQISDGFSTISLGSVTHRGGIVISENLNSNETLKLTQGEGQIEVNSTISTANSKELIIENNGITTQGSVGAIVSDSLLLLGTGSHFLNSQNNNINVIAANTGGISYTDIDGLDINTVSNVDGITSTGDISIKTLSDNKLDDLQISKSVITSSSSSNAIYLNAGVNEDVDDTMLSDRADIKYNGGLVQVGNGGTATLLTGSINGSQNVASIISGGNFRYGSDESQTNYTSPLSTGLNLIYRERPNLSITIEDSTSTYDGNGFTSVNFSAVGYVNNDELILPTEIVFGGSAIGAVNPGTYSLTALASSLGYQISSNEAIHIIQEAPEVPDSLPESSEPLPEVDIPQLEIVVDNDLGGNEEVSINMDGLELTSSDNNGDEVIEAEEGADEFSFNADGLGDPDNVNVTTIKGFDPALDKIDISEALVGLGFSDIGELDENLSVNTSGNNTEIQILDNDRTALKKIVIEDVTVDDILDVTSSVNTSYEVIESMILSGLLVVFQGNSSELGTTSNDTLVATDTGQGLYSGPGNDVLFGSNGSDVLVGGKGQDSLTGGQGADTFLWVSSDYNSEILTTDTVIDFSVENDNVKISDSSLEKIISESSNTKLLEYIRPEFTKDGLELHIHEETGTIVQVIKLNNIKAENLNLPVDATSIQILNSLLNEKLLNL